MKKIVCAIMIAASFVACNKVDNSLYFDNSDNRVFDDATAELDTLSYAVGMNLGLGLRFQPSGVTFNYEVLMNAMAEELEKNVFDYEAIDANKALVKRFTSERLQPFAIAQFAKGKTEGLPNGNGNLHDIFNEEFTQDRVSEMFGRDMASYIYLAAYPLNMHWLRTAINDAASAEGNEVHDSLMRITVLQMRGALRNYHTRIHPEYIVEASKAWLESVSKQPNVQTMVVDEYDTLYFRVNKAGNDVKPRSMNDTIAFSYDLYTRSGKLVESHTKRANEIREALELEKADTVQDERRQARIKQLSDQLENVENLRVPMSKALLKGLQYGIQNIGEGGEITIWMPAPLAFGERGNRVVHGHDAVVMNVKLKSVSYGPTDEELEAIERERRAKPVEIPNGFFAPKQKGPKAGDLPVKPAGDKKNIIQPVELK